jgi:polar amino acid transport system substrate-binding protein
MKKLTILLVSAVAVLAAVAAAASAATHATATATATCPTVKSGQLTIGTDNPAYPPVRGRTKGRPWKIHDPATGKGYESAVAYAIAKQLGFSRAQVKWAYVPATRRSPGSVFDFDISQISYAGAGEVSTSSTSYYDEPGAGRAQGLEDRRRPQRRRMKPSGRHGSMTSYAFIKSVIKPSRQPAVYNQNAPPCLRSRTRIDGLMVACRRRSTSPPAVPNSRSSASSRPQEGDRPLRRAAEGNADVVREQGVSTLRTNGTQAPAAVAGSDRRADLK